MRWEKVSAIQGLILIGQSSSRTGKVIVRGPRGCLRTYTFKRRIGDGKAFVRWGQLVGATACYQRDRLLSVIFDIQPRHTPPSARAAIAKAEGRS